MDIQKIPTAWLNLAACNPTKDLKRSIAEFGFVEPVIWNRKTGNVVGSHQRLKVLLDLGVTDIDCVVVDLDIQRMDCEGSHRNPRLHHRNQNEV